MDFKYIKNISSNEGTILLYSQIGDSIDENGKRVKLTINQDTEGGGTTGEGFGRRVAVWGDEQKPMANDPDWIDAVRWSTFICEDILDILKKYTTVLQINDSIANKIQSLQKDLVMRMFQYKKGPVLEHEILNAYNAGILNITGVVGGVGGSVW